MVSLSKLSPKYQITVPSEVREKLGAKPGDRIVFQTNAQGEVVISAISNISAKELAGSLRRTNITPTTSQADGNAQSNTSNGTQMHGQSVHQQHSEEWR